MNFSMSDVLDLLYSLSGKKILIVGDLMLDAYYFGETERISPEAPVPVVRIEQEKYVLGGAGNVARNIAALGGIPTLIGLTGKDAEADTIADLMSKECINSALVATTERRTTVKTRILARHQQLLRMDKEDSAPFTNNEVKAVLEKIKEQLPHHDVIVLSDYAKGLVSQAFMDGFHSLVAQSERKPAVMIDPKPSNFSLYVGATLLTPNAKETAECAGMPTRTRSEIIAAGKAIMDKTLSPYLLTTLGPEGMALFSKSGQVWHIPTTARDVFDVTGAGDTVIATLALAIAAGGSPLPSCVLANYAAGIVVASVGAATATPQQIKDAIAALPTPSITRWE